METENTPCSALDICNSALSKIGEAPIGALSPNESSASRMCHLHYHPTRRETLCLSRWTFATRETVLETDDGGGAPYSKLPFHFMLPADCLRVLDVECGLWTMRGRKIQASQPSLRMTYISDVEDCGSFDPLFTEALTTHLAEKLAVPLTSSQSLRQSLSQEFHRVILPLAATTNAVQSHSNDSLPLANLLNRGRRMWRNCE